MSTEPSATNDDIQRRKEILVAELKRIAGDADELLKQLADSTSDELESMRRTIEATLSEARARIDEARIVVSRKACSAATATNVYVRENPWKAVGVASLLGMVAASLLYRRSGT